MINNHRTFHCTAFPVLLVLLQFFALIGSSKAAEPTVDFLGKVQPILNKYCSGCHSEADHEGGFSSESYQSLQAGIKGKPVILAGDVAGSLLLRVLDKNAENAMPPEDEPRPTAAEIAVLQSWIKAGAKGPKGMQTNRLTLNVPVITPHLNHQPITSVDCAESGLIAVGRFKEVSIFNPDLKSAASGSLLKLTTPLFQIDNLPGKVNALNFSPDGTRLAIASGVSGRGGLISVFNLNTRKTERSFSGHLDLIYDIEFSPAGDQLATCSYDKSIILWDANTGQELRRFSGHNGAVYDLSFSPDGQSLLSASADDTCKVWRVSDGVRLDTLGQPLKEEYACTFSPDGKLMAAVGADKKLRIWNRVSFKQPKNNPQRYARFAHEATVSHLLWRPQGTQLLSFADNGIIKLWETGEFHEVFQWNEKQKEVISAVAMRPQGDGFFAGRLDGSLSWYAIPSDNKLYQQTGPGSEVVSHIPQVTGEMVAVNEKEPNQTPKLAQKVNLPVKIAGKIQGMPEKHADFDLFRISVKQGEQWILEVRAARDKSPLDSHIEVLTSTGEKIKRLNLQAVRESYFTFRGKTSDQTGDFRIFNWTEMKLNEYLYANGEVTRFYHYPRGADSGFNVYPVKGKRWGYFDTSPLSHALGEPCYVVQPLSPNATIVPNGLPVFPVFFENDDAALRDTGKDSRLFFTAPATGEYLVKISDVRGSEGADFSYSLEIRPPQPNFSPRILSETLTLFAGSRQEFQVGITRTDGFDGPVEVLCDLVPDGIHVTSPIVIEAGQIEAQGVISVDPGFEIPKDLAKAIHFSARAKIGENVVTHKLNGFKELKSGEAPKLALSIVAAPSGLQPISSPDAKLLEFVVVPGETILLKVIAKRNGFDGPIPFGREDSSRNLPFGTYIDNIGLNGLLITEKSNEREFFITCDPVTKPQSRLFHLRTASAGGQASQPVMLHVRKKR
ncbi:MAG: hypothetical protein JKY95_01970 [Planctomycetaceae bacterium]|nr:hypothetical protein [Planctomycetaceae bacterium]